VLPACCYRRLYKKIKANQRNVTMMRPAVAGVDKRSKSSHDLIFFSRITINKVTPHYNGNPEHCLLSGAISPV
jgi:hypothetical protein